MPAPAFSELVGRLTEAFGQRPDAMRPTPEGFLLKTTDDFLYAFLEDPARVSLATVQGLLREAADRPSHLVVFAPGRLPLAFTAELLGKGATVVDGGRFRELVTGLNLGSYLGEEPRPAAAAGETRQLPSARQLDEVVVRARTWLDWGVPALALRFFRQALELKPEFVPARNGVGRSLLALGLVSDAQRIFQEIIAASPDNLEARLGLAAAAGASGQPDAEIGMYRALIAEDPSRTEARAHLVAALIDAGRWAEVTPELEGMLGATPEDARLRFLYGAALAKTGHEAEGRREIEQARALGLEFQAERSLSEHLGLPPPARPPPAVARGPGPGGQGAGGQGEPVAVAPTGNRPESPKAPRRARPKPARPGPSARSRRPSRRRGKAK